VIGGILFGLLGLVVIILTARNIRFAFSHGWVSAYGRQVTRDTQPIAFGVSVCLAIVGFLFGLIITTVAIAGLAGLLKS